MKKATSISMVEFIILMASLVALGAMSTDSMLPALSQMGKDLGLKDPNDAQFIVSFIFIGFAIGQIFYGPLSDSIGRKKSIYISLCIFIFGSFVSMVSDDFNSMLFGRFLQGVGASGPKIVTLALIRDVFKGRDMAKVMSFIAMVFVLVPAFAPVVGGFILKFGSWHHIFFMFIFSSIFSLIWFAIRQDETLLISERKALNFSTIKSDILEVLKNRFTMSYTAILGILFGIFLSYLSTAEQIFAFQYSLGEDFPIYFAINALSFGMASIINAKLVGKMGMRYLSKKSAQIFSVICLIYIFVTSITNGNPPLLVFMIFCMISFFCIGILFGNLNALAMEPMGHIAGTAAAVIGSFSTFISIPIGMVIGQLYNNTITPMIISFTFASIASLFILIKIEKKTD